MDVIIGMDPHKRSATIEVIDEQGRVLAAGILVLSGRPAQVSFELEINLPRPRRRIDPSFQQHEIALERALAGTASCEPGAAAPTKLPAPAPNNPDAARLAEQAPL